MRRLLIIAFFLVVLGAPLAAGAANSCDPGRILPPCTCDGSCSVENFLDLFVNLYKFGLEVLGPVAILFIAIGGTVLLTAAGYSSRIELGKTIINQAIAGTIIVLVSWIIVDTTVLLLTGNSDRTVFGTPWYRGFTYHCEDERLSQGCEGVNVRTVQSNLSRLGYEVDVDGVYGSQTAAGVRKFQSDANNIVNTIASLSCSQDLWDLVFHPDGSKCNGDPSDPSCKVTPTKADAETLQVNGIVDAQTQARLGAIVASPYRQAFIDSCVTAQ